MRSKSRRLGGCIPKAVTSLPSPKAESKGRSQRDGSSAGRTRGEEGMGGGIGARREQVGLVNLYKLKEGASPKIQGPQVAEFACEDSQDMSN